MEHNRSLVVFVPPSWPDQDIDEDVLRDILVDVRGAIAFEDDKFRDMAHYVAEHGSMFRYDPLPFLSHADAQGYRDAAEKSLPEFIKVATSMRCR
jgi:hypothetical protein